MYPLSGCLICCCHQFCVAATQTMSHTVYWLLIWLRWSSRTVKHGLFLLLLLLFDTIQNAIPVKVAVWYGVIKAYFVTSFRVIYLSYFCFNSQIDHQKIIQTKLSVIIWTYNAQQIWVLIIQHTPTPNGTRKREFFHHHPFAINLYIEILVFILQTNVVEQRRNRFGFCLNCDAHRLFYFC